MGRNLHITGARRAVYVGPRGGRYVMKNGAYVPLPQQTGGSGTKPSLRRVSSLFGSQARHMIANLLLDRHARPISARRVDARHGVTREIAKYRVPDGEFRLVLNTIPKPSLNWYYSEPTSTTPENNLTDDWAPNLVAILMDLRGKIVENFSENPAVIKEFNKTMPMKYCIDGKFDSCLYLIVDRTQENRPSRWVYGPAKYAADIPEITDTLYQPPVMHALLASLRAKLLEKFWPDAKAISDFDGKFGKKHSVRQNAAADGDLSRGRGAATQSQVGRSAAATAEGGLTAPCARASGVLRGTPCTASRGCPMPQAIVGCFSTMSSISRKLSPPWKSHSWPS